MYPLLLDPVCTDYLWGGDRLKTEYNIISDKQPLAECWCLSALRGSSCTVQNGEYSGMPLCDVLDEFGIDFLGKNCEDADEFPLLIKLIDAKEQLSVQVHPDDDYARENEGKSGKSEMWYILDAAPGSYIYYGFSRRLSKNELIDIIDNGDICDVCNKVEVHKGECYFIPAGMIHSIGAGVLVCEVQQSSDLTYRVYDFDRVDANSRKRALHKDKAVDVLETAPTSVCENFCPEPEMTDGGYVKTLAKYKYFDVKLYGVDTCISLYDEDSFMALVCLSGECDVAYDDGFVHLYKGSCALIPAGVSVDLTGGAEILCAKV